MKQLKQFEFTITDYMEMNTTLSQKNDVKILGDAKKNKFVVFFHYKPLTTLPFEIYIFLKDVITKLDNLEFICCYPDFFVALYPEFEKYFEIESSKEIFVSATQHETDIYKCLTTIFEKGD